MFDRLNYLLAVAVSSLLGRLSFACASLVQQDQTLLTAAVLPSAVLPSAVLPSWLCNIRWRHQALTLALRRCAGTDTESNQNSEILTGHHNRSLPLKPFFISVVQWLTNYSQAHKISVLLTLFIVMP